MTELCQYYDRAITTLVFGEILTFSGALIGIDAKYIHRIDTVPKVITVTKAAREPPKLFVYD